MSIQSLLLGLGGNLMWQTLLIAIMVFTLFKSLPRTEARLRYRIALSALLGCVLLLAAPFLPNLTPQLSVGIAPETVSTMVAAPANPAEIAPGIIADTILAEVKRELPLGLTLLTVWAIGIVISLARLLRAATLGRRWVQRSVPIEVYDDLHLTHPVPVRRSDEISAPLVLGFVRPVILVPAGFDPQSTGARAVLEHEIAHIERGDLWMNLAQRLVLALLWWCLPLYWLNQQINTEREKLCDDIAAGRIGNGRTLANALLDIAETNVRTKDQLLAIGIHPKAGHLAERITRLCKEAHMPKLSKKLLLTSSLAIPVLIGGLVLAAPRAVAHSSHSSHSPNDTNMRDVSALQYALFMATAKNSVDEVRDILGMGIDPAFHLHGDGTPLILAAKTGNVEIADLLLTHGAEINRMTASDESALINAVKTGHYDMVEFLVGRGADVSLGQLSNPMHRPEWRSPLSTAQKHRKVRIAQFLQSQGAVADTRKSGASSQIQKIVDGRLTSKFGAARKKFGGKTHNGIDIANKTGTPIFAPADGTIVEVTDTYKGKTTWGHVVVLQSAGGVETVFAHLNDSQVLTGDSVRLGQQIARVGNTGKSTGSHVHITTTVNGELINPLQVWPSLAR